MACRGNNIEDNMKYKTMKEYLGGGYMKPMLYQTGGYIPGLSRARYGLGLQRDVTRAQEEFEEQSRRLAEEQRGRGLLSGAGKALGTALGAALAPATGGLSLVAAKGIGSALGSGLGELAGGKLYDAGDMKASKTGLFREDFAKLKEMEKASEEGVLDRAIGAGAGTALGAGLGMAVDKLGSYAPGELFDKAKYKLKGALGRAGGAKYSDPVKADFGATFNQGTGLYGDLPIESLDGFDPTEMAYLESLPRAQSLGEANQLVGMAQESMALEAQMRELAENLGGIIDAQTSPTGMMKGGQLKEVPEGNKGLMNLPEEVRNKMGYMMKGGMMDNYMYGGMAKKKKKYGYMGGGLLDMMPFSRRIV